MPLPSLPWTCLLAQSPTARRQRLCYNRTERRHQWPSASLKPVYKGKKTEINIQVLMVTPLVLSDSSQPFSGKSTNTQYPSFICEVYQTQFWNLQASGTVWGSLENSPHVPKHRARPPSLRYSLEVAWKAILSFLSILRRAWRNTEMGSCWNH